MNHNDNRYRIHKPTKLGHSDDDYNIIIHVADETITTITSSPPRLIMQSFYLSLHDSSPYAGVHPRPSNALDILCCYHRRRPYATAEEPYCSCYHDTRHRHRHRHRHPQVGLMMTPAATSVMMKSTLQPP